MVCILHKNCISLFGILSTTSNIGKNFVSGNTDSQYKSTSGEEYGRKWRSNRPPGLPIWARKAGSRGSALGTVRKEAMKHGLGPTFVKAVEQMARTESGATFGLPANTFNANPPHLRPPGKRLITAWGTFQFNRDAWTSLIPGSQKNSYKSFKSKGDAGCGSDSGCVYPWDSTPEEEVSRPIKKYAQLFQEVKRLGGSDVDSAIGLRIWHISPIVLYEKYKKKGEQMGFKVAWNSLSSKMKSRIRSFLNGGGISLPYSSEVEWESDNEFWGSWYSN